MSTLLDSARVERIGGSLSRIAGQRKVRTPTGSRLDNIQARKRDGKCNREQTAELLPQGSGGKGETVR